MINTLLAVSLIAAAFLIALAVLLVFGLLDRRRISQLRSFTEAERDAIVFIFENEALLDATPAARQLLTTAHRQGSAWSHLATILSPRFPQMNDWVKDLAQMGNMELKSTDGTSLLLAEWHDGVARITLDAVENHDAAGLDRHSLMAMNQELESLRTTAEQTPFPVWRVDTSGTIMWCNTAYLELTDSVNGTDDLRPWPPRSVFDLGEKTLNAPASDGQPALHRAALSLSGEATRRWFEITEVDVDGANRLYSAMPADKLVRAETSLKEFVTTLTKTFASLPIGLAIFDDNRELALFNPALMDLTLLPAEFLIGKPSLSSFLDKLREQRMIPEPKDYKSWRRQMSDLVAAAQNGTYKETWALPTGATYRVTGQPHPGGAVALLFEDISSEISLTRRFRSEIETGQATLDAMPQAVAVFTSGGTLTISNTAYSDLWGHDPSTSVGEVTADSMIATWQARCAPSPLWDQLRSFVAPRSGGAREQWTGRVSLDDGRALTCRATPLAQGATLIDFTQQLATGGIAHDRGALNPVAEAEIQERLRMSAEA